MPITPAPPGPAETLLALQIRMARSALNWSAATLARKAGVHANTVKRIESAKPSRTDTLSLLVQALSREGVIFSERGIELSDRILVIEAGKVSLARPGRYGCSARGTEGGP